MMFSFLKHWDSIVKARKQNRFCGRVCANRHNARTRPSTRGWVTTSKGYIALRDPDHPMADKTGYVLEHRAVVAERIGRTLEPFEVVHHINGVRGDNRPENLELMIKSDHDRLDRKPPEPFPCPHCGGMIASRAYVGTVEAVSSDAQ